MLNITQWFYSGGHFLEVVTNEILCYHIMHMKRCIQNNIFMLMADRVNIIIFGGLGCIWPFIYGKTCTKFCTENFVAISMIFSFISQAILN